MEFDPQRAIADPAAVFDDPEQVLGAQLTREQKLAILRRWEYDMRELSVAEDENMGGGESSAMLPRVRAALRTLQRPGESSNTNPSGPATRHGP
jgi:hypothetical protein